MKALLKAIVHSQKIIIYYNSNLKKLLQNDPKKVAPIHAKALQAKQISQQAYDFIETLKNQIVQEAGGYDLETGMVKNASEINKPNQFFVEVGDKNGKALKNKLQVRATPINYRVTV